MAVTGGQSRQTWIELCQKGRADPHDLVGRNVDKLFKLVLEASTTKVFEEASYRAISVLAFVSPEVILPRVVEQLRADINPETINALTDLDLGVWATPEGTTFVDGNDTSHLLVSAHADIHTRSPVI